MKNRNNILLLVALLIGLQPIKSQDKLIKQNMSSNQLYQTATFGAGCFWCVEAIYSRLKGVVSVTPGYCGGNVQNPTYKEVCPGETGHAEAVQIVYDPNVISYAKLLEVFFKTHNPTTLNRQGEDIGTQYRSIIFYHDEVQKKVAQEVKEMLDKSGIWDDPIVTLIEPFKTFYIAEKYHQEYFENNPKQPYCQMVINPKVEKFEKLFKDYLKK